MKQQGMNHQPPSPYHQQSHHKNRQIHYNSDEIKQLHSTWNNRGWTSNPHPQPPTEPPQNPQIHYNSNEIKQLQGAAAQAEFTIHSISNHNRYKHASTTTYLDEERRRGADLEKH